MSRHFTESRPRESNPRPIHYEIFFGGFLTTANIALTCGVARHNWTRVPLGCPELSHVRPREPPKLIGNELTTKPRRATTSASSTASKPRRARRSFGKIEQLPSGRYRAQYTGPDGNRHSGPMTFRTKGDADAWLATQQAAIVKGEWGPAQITAKHEKQAKQAVRFGDYAREWISTRVSSKGQPLRPTTVANYENMLRGPLAEFDRIPISQITPDKVRRWNSRLVATGKKSFAAYAYRLLRAVLNTAVDEKLIVENPCKVRGASSARTGKKVLPPTSAEYAIIEASMPEHLRAAVVIAAWGALRYGEMTELRRKDITFDGDVCLIRVERAVTWVRGRGFIVGPVKSEAGNRTVAMPAKFATEIRDHLERFAAPGDDGLLFPNQAGGHLGTTSFYRHWYPARAAAGREDMPWHALRHFGLTRYAAAGATQKELLDRAGHTRMDVALGYQHGLGRDAELAARMAELA